MSDISQPAAPAHAVRAASRLDAYKAAARPTGIYLLTLAVIGAVFDAGVTLEKLSVAVTLLGAFAGLRTLDKKITSSANP